jgi:hypothetical protein
MLSMPHERAVLQTSFAVFKRSVNENSSLCRGGGFAVRTDLYIECSKAGSRQVHARDDEIQLRLRLNCQIFSRRAEDREDTLFFPHHQLTARAQTTQRGASQHEGVLHNAADSSTR